MSQMLSGDFITVQLKTAWGARDPEFKSRRPDQLLLPVNQALPLPAGLPKNLRFLLQGPLQGPSCLFGFYTGHRVAR